MPAKWWASGGGVAVSGPYTSERAARDRFRTVPGSDVGFPFPRDLQVWQSDLDEHAAVADHWRAVERGRVRRLLDQATKEMIHGR